ncbi:uncharacterized protein LOC141813127 isoform X2 [Curcuma longa]|uniref:uncharacterized protein LOC141813127 isoform X2 n=1 Tax=Curcuma longa TaxID=136217 RepID=UPI003D9E7C74
MASSKRPLSEDGEIGEGSGRLKRSRSLIIFRDAKRAQISRPVLTREDLLPRRAMQEVRPLLTNSAPPVPRYQLRFQNCLPNCVYTCREIMTKDKDPLQISLVDTATGDVVAFGPLSSENIMVLVLDGLYCGTKQKDKKEFENHIVRQRDGKGPLLKGKLVIQLTDGVGYLQDISFTDNSSWTPSKKFRLAVCCETEGIQEGISDPFRVKELRSALNEKHHPPKLTDQVWNLEKIRKDGRYHQRLTKAGILNVQQFLLALSINPENLRMLLQNGSSPKRRIPDKEWEAIITNAQECIQEFNDLVTESISLSVSCPQCSVEASRQVKFFESVAPYSQLGHTNQEDTSEQLIHPLVRATIPPTHAAFPGQNLGSSCFSGYVQSEVNRTMPDTCNFQAVFQLEDVMDIQPEINNPLVNQLWLIPTSDDATVAESNNSAIWYQVTENDQVGLEQPSQEFFGHSHEALGFPNIGSEHVYTRCSSFSGSLGGLSDFESICSFESIWEQTQSVPMVLDNVRSTSKWVKLLAVLRCGLFAYLSTRKLGNTSDHPKELV